MTLSILIINWNSCDFLRQCLNAIRETCAELRPKVIVVDTASYDGCADMLQHDFPDIEFLQCESNIGFGRANNLGFARVTSDALLLLNPDTKLFPGAVQLLLHELERLPNAGILGPRIQNADETLQTSCVRALPTPLNQVLSAEVLHKAFPRLRLWGSWDAFHARDSLEVQALSGACMMIKTQTYEKLGGFSPEFFMYGEDLDLCFKAHKAGFKQYYVPNACVLHYGGRSSERAFRKFSVVMKLSSDCKLISKWHGRFAGVAYRAGMGISAVGRVCVLLMLAGCAKSSTRPKRIYSLLKWWAILRWTLGFERWVRNYAPAPPGKMR